MSWLDFNARVFYESLRKSNSVFEKLNFLLIVSTNLNEFFCVRAAALLHLVAENPDAKDSSQMPVRDVLREMYKRSGALLQKVYAQLQDVFSVLEETGICYQQSGFDGWAVTDFLAHCAPEPAAVSRLENQKTYAVFCFDDGAEAIRLPARRLFWLDERHFTTADDVVLGCSRHFFGDKNVLCAFTISIDRDCDRAVADCANPAKYISAMERSLELRKFSTATRVVVHVRSGDERAVRAWIGGAASDEQVFFVPGFVHPEFLLGLRKGFRHYDFSLLARKDAEPFPDMMVRFRSLTTNHRPCCPHIVASSMFSYLDKKDLVVHFPYESYFPVLKFISDAAENPDVTEIKITLYRTERNSRIVNELVLAALKGKKITVFMEIKARFNERLNIRLGKILEDAGITVLYRVPHLKVHAKIALVVAKNALYANVGTGNYNSETSYIYSDIALFTSKKQIAEPIAQIFGAIEKNPRSLSDMRRSPLRFSAGECAVFTSPFFMKRTIISLIRGEAARGADGLIVAKMNNLGDEEILFELEKAARRGVLILLNVRGICQLRPSGRMRIVSIVGKFLEHSRIFCFGRGDAEKLFVSSSDWMRRNFDKRLEVMFEILDAECREKIKAILMTYFDDESHAHRMNADGTWREPENADGFCAQEFLLRNALTQPFL